MHDPSNSFELETKYQEAMKFLIWGESYMEYMPEEYRNGEQKYHTITDLSSDEFAVCSDKLFTIYQDMREGDDNEVITEWQNFIKE